MSKRKQAEQVKPTNKPSFSFKFHWLLAIAAFLVYANSLNNGYNIDDILVTEKNPLIEKGFSAIPEIFSTNYVNEQGVKVDYRPLVKTTFAIEYQLWGYNPMLSHLINVLLFVLVVLLFYRLLKFIFKDKYQLEVKAAALLFALSPACTEVVDNLKNRDELMALAFVLLAAHAFLQYQRLSKNSLLIGALGFFFLGLLSKISSVTYLFAIPIILFSETKKPKAALISLGSMVLLLVLYIAAAKLMLGQLFRTGYFLETPLSFTHDLSIRIGSSLNTLLFYFTKMLVPYQFGFYYGYNQIALIPFYHIRALLALVIYALLAAASYFAWKKEERFLFLGLSIFLTSIAYFSNIALDYYGIVGDRSMFIPFTGFAMIISWLLFFIGEKISQQKMANWPLVPLVLLVMVSLAYAGRTFSRNEDWHDKIRLYRHDIAYLDQSAKAHFILAKTLRDEAKLEAPMLSKKEFAGAIDEAYAHFRKAASIYPDYAAAWEGAGLLSAIDKHDISTAKYCFHQALRADSSSWRSSFNLGNCYVEENKLDSAYTNFEQTIKFNPDHEKSLLNLINISFARSDFAACKVYNEKMKTLHPEQGQPYITDAFMQMAKHDSADGMHSLETAFQKSVRDKELGALIFRYYSQHGQADKAAPFQQYAR